MTLIHKIYFLLYIIGLSESKPSWLLVDTKSDGATGSEVITDSNSTVANTKKTGHGKDYWLFSDEDSYYEEYSDEDDVNPGGENGINAMSNRGRIGVLRH